jgi:FKBP-type peptidyl-prolyl cis-trans isomerase 2
MVSVKKGDFVRMEYTGRVAATGQVFETTDESVAKKAGIYEPNSIYGPKLAIFGSRMIMRGIEEAIESTTMGKEEEFTLSPEQAFGKKEQSLIRLMPQKDFARQNIKPVPGMVISLDSMLATVKSVTSGRVVVDFNHPLAGEKVTYSLKVTEIISDERHKLEAMLGSLGIKGNVEEKDGKLEVLFEKGQPSEKIEAAKRAMLAVVPGATFTSA